jgi:NADH-quinone oxidoreductase subunit N
VFASAVMLYGMSLLYGVTGSTLLSEIGSKLTVEGQFGGVEALAITFVIIGFAFKVSAVPFHSWAPDTYEGAPTPVTAFLSVASKAAGFVALVTLIYVGFPQAKDVWQPFIWVMAAVTMTVGNLLALRQTNIVRMLAYSSISQGGFILMPLAVAGTGDAAGPALQAVIVYLLVYAAMNLGMFAVVIAASRTTRSGEISSFGGLFSYAPALGVLMTIFLASLAGIPPLGGWIAKFSAFRAVLEAGNGWAYAIAVIGAINSVVAFGYYGNIMREVWMKPAPNGETSAVRTPSSLVAALSITVAGTLLFGILPGTIMRFGDLVDLTGAFGG